MSAPAVQQIDHELLADLFLSSELLSGEPDLAVGNKQRDFVAPFRQFFEECSVLNCEPMQFGPRPVWLMLQAKDKGLEFLRG
ncbi:hypothetical protein D3C86_1597900 [compost metagenome]